MRLLLLIALVTAPATATAPPFGDPLGGGLARDLMQRASGRSGVAPADEDGDGYGADVDCDDEDPTAWPGNDEYCDNVDNDCDEAVDEGEAVDAPYWYADVDGDGYGDPDAGEQSCEPLSGTVDNDDDCDDDDLAVSPDAEEYCDGIDNDCDGTLDNDNALDASLFYADADGDGYGDLTTTATGCDAPSGYVSDATDCDDSDAGSNPGADEVCDGADNDCDEAYDEDDAVDAGTWYADDDDDGWGDVDDAAVGCSPPDGYVAADGDCDDADPESYPDAAEQCDGLDNDCDDVLDEGAGDASTWYWDGDGDGYGDEAVEACDQPSGASAEGGDCDDTDPDYNPGAEESDCSDPNDYDCDGEVSYVDEDNDGWALCEDCDDNDDARNPGRPEVCNGIDDDCDEDVDDEDDDLVDGVDWYADADGDGHGDPDALTNACDQPSGAVTLDAADDCDDADPAVYPGAEDPPGDGIDQDCDGVDGEDDSGLDGGDDGDDGDDEGDESLALGADTGGPSKDSAGCAAQGAGGGWALLLGLPLLARRRRSLSPG